MTRPEKTKGAVSMKFDVGHTSIVVIPSAVEGSRDVTFQIPHPDPSTPLGMTNFWLRVTEVPRERLHPKRVRPMCFLQHRRTDTIRSEQSDQTRQCLMQLHGIAQCCFEKSKLLSHRT